MGTSRRKPYAGTPAVAASTGEPQRTSARSSLEEFQAWMTRAGITWDTSLIQLRAGNQPESKGANTTRECSSGSGLKESLSSHAPWAVIAVADVPEGQVLATVPRHAVLSAANSSLADLLAVERLGGGLALVAAVMYEAARGPRSKWYSYLSSLPYREYLPVFWSEEELQRLEGTDLAEKARADRQAMKADFESELLPLLNRYPARLGPLRHGWNLQAFMRAASWVASRAFYVDEHHGDALVPLADVFNHKAARVDLRGRSGGWADGLAVAEHDDARRQLLQQRRSGHPGSKAAASTSQPASRKRRQGMLGNDDDDDEEEEVADGSSDEIGSSDSGGDGDENEEEHGDGEVDEDSDEGSVSASADDGDCSSGSLEGMGGGSLRDQKQLRSSSRRGRGGRAAAAAMDRDPADDRTDPWPRPPPQLIPPPPVLTRSVAAGGEMAPLRCAAGNRCDDGGGEGAVFRGRWALLASAAVFRGCGRNLHLDIGICAGERGGCELLDIVAAQPLKAGDEVYNTYGEHGNGELVNKYGFALPDNPFDELLLSKGAVLAATEAVVGRKAAKNRTRLLQKHSELLSEEEEPFLLLPPCHVNIALYVALRVLAAGQEEAARWGSLEDALKPLRSAWRRERQEHQQKHKEELQASQQDEQQRTRTVTALRAERPCDGVQQGREDSAAGGASICKVAKRRRSTVRSNDEGADMEKLQEEHPASDEGCGFMNRANVKTATNVSAMNRAAGPLPQRVQQQRQQQRAGSNSSSRDVRERHRHDDSDDNTRESDSGSDSDDLPEDVEIQSAQWGASGFKAGGLECMSPVKIKGGAQQTAAASNKRWQRQQVKRRVADQEVLSVTLWTQEMQAVLRRVVSDRLAAYATTVEEDNLELEKLQELEGVEQVAEVCEEVSAHESISTYRVQESIKEASKSWKDDLSQWRREGGRIGIGLSSMTAEAVGAYRSALLLQLGEKRLLRGVLAQLG